MTGVLIDRELQGRIGLTDHAIARFAQRSGLPYADRQTLEPVLRDLLIQEGRLVSERPRWSRSQNPADAYIQVGEWLVLICRHDVRRPGRWTVVTVVSRPAAPTWERAVARGWVGTPPPLRLSRPRRGRVGVAAAIRAARGGGSGRWSWVGRRIVGELRARRAAVRAEHRRALAEYEARRTEHTEQRRRAREAHAERWG